MSKVIKGRGLRDFSFKEAAGKVPPEFLTAWEWFAGKYGERIPRLPFGKGKPEGMPMPLARQAAIFCPSYPGLPSKGAGKKRYALSVYSVGQSVYADGDAKTRQDGTWVLHYHDQRGKDPYQDYNQLMLNCLDDCVPLGVMVKSPKGGYDVLGLGIVEEYDPASHLFVLHGPAELDASNMTHERDLEGFRTIVMDAYEGACAITDVDIPEILDALVVDDLGDDESLVVRNGILLRADVGRLFDSNLIGVEPDSHRVLVSRRLTGSGYVRLDGCEVREPRAEAQRLDLASLERRYRVYRALESKR